MRVQKTEIFGTPFIGIFAIATEKVIFLPNGFDKKHGGDVFSEILKTEIKQLSIYNSPLIGIFGKANSHGLVIPEISEKPKVEGVSTVSDKLTALGNLILANDFGAIISPEFSKKAEKEIQDGLGVPVVRGTIGGSGLVGSFGFATNKGVLLSPKATEKEIEVVKSVLKVKNCGVGSLNRGSDFLGACAVGNSEGCLVGSTTTPIEITRMEDVFNG